MKQILLTLILSAFLLFSCNSNKSNNGMQFETSILLPDFNIPIVEFSILDNSYNFIIDSGSEESYLNESLYNYYLDSLQITDTIYSSIQTFSGDTDLNKFYEVNVFLNDTISAKMIVINMDNIVENIFINSGKRVYGVIGSDILTEYNAVIDYKNKRLRLSR